jgi:hypothetical protein
MIAVGRLRSAMPSREAQNRAPSDLEELTMDEAVARAHPEPWNKGKLVGQKAPFKLKEIWAIRVRLQLSRRARDLALRSWYRQQAARLRSRQVEGPRHLPRRPHRRAGHRHATKDLSTGAVRDHRAHARDRGRLDQGGRFAPRKTTSSQAASIKSPHLGTRQYARIVDVWVEEIGLDLLSMGHSRCAARRRR